ncbi:MAG: response regulator, partial [Selenomonadaceae bacterium]|nr:response regulator [Selenomonadaceae bacterium]
MIRVLIADDSAFMRKVLSDLFNSQSDFQVVGTAVNGQDAIEKVKRFQPDVLTLDVIMPVMDGLNALAVIMEQCPLPVVMVSSTTQKGTNETIRALALGAVDFVSKAGGAISKIDTIKDEILA